MKGLCRLLVVGVMAVTAGGAVRADEAALKREIDALRRDVEALKKEVAALKPGGVPTKDTLTARFEAAKGLRTVADEQKALAAVALDAAKAGEVELTTKAVAALRTVDLEQQTMYKAAIFLAKAGKEKDAIALAKKLRTTELEQKALTKIASGELDD